MFDRLLRIFIKQKGVHFYSKLLCIMLFAPFLVQASLLKPTNSPIIVDADQFEYFGGNDDKILLQGNAQIAQDNQKISADFIEYDKKLDQIMAQGHVRMIQENGNILDTNKAILHDNFKLGSIERFTVRLSDGSTLKGESAQKKDQELANIQRGYFTSCKICAGKSPIWDISASSVDFNQKKNNVTYRNAVVKFYGMPIMYTPYFSHYTKDAERKSGFLTASYGSDTYLGHYIKAPYYFNLAPNYDLTITPVLTTKRKYILEGEYRHLFANGALSTFGSIAPTEFHAKDPINSKTNKKFRYTLSSKGDFSLPKNHNTGWDIKIASDKTYRRNYKYGDEDFLTSKVYLNSYMDKSFYEIQSLSFQDMRPDKPMHQMPVILPLFNSNYQVHQFSDDSTLNFESNLLKIYRYAGADTNRISGKGIWQKPLLLDNGHSFKLFTSLRSDVYHYRDALINGKNYTGNVARTIPEAGIAWSYPLGKNIGESNIIITPLANVIYTPHLNYNKKIYSEDSQTSELNDSNLFSSSQFTGIDLVETTSRVSYGLDSMLYYKDYLNVNALFGQIYRQHPQNYLTGLSGESNFSDYVGRLKFDFNNSVTLAYHFKLDNKTFLNKANEVMLLLKYEKLYMLTDLLYYRDNIDVNNVKNRREIFTEIGVSDYKNLSFSVNARKNLSNKKDLTNPGGMISVGSKFKYIDDCITYSFGIERDYTKNDIKKKNTTWWFNIGLKNIDY